jgi:hypothetical protein
VVSLFDAEGASQATLHASMGLLRGWILDHVVEVDGALGAYALIDA